jgi:dipeptidyl aminopeptidase/acylaminoacyl peptidase
MTRRLPCWLTAGLALCIGGLAQAQTAPTPAAAASAPAYQGLGADSVPAEVLARFRPPPLPAELSRQVQALLDVRSPGLGRPSPDGQRLYFGWRVTGVDQVWRLDGPLAFPRQLTGGEDRTTLAGVSPDGRWLALQRDRGGAENPGLYLQSAEGGPLRRLQHVDRVQTVFQGFSRDGRHLYWAANDVRPGDYALYRHDIPSGTTERLHDGRGYWRIADIAGDGRLLLVQATGSSGREWWLFDEAARTLQPLLGQGERVDWRLAFGPRPGEYFVATPKFGDWRRLYRWRPGGGFEPLPVPGGDRWDVEDFDIDPARRRLYVSRNEGGYTRTSVLDATTLQPLPLPWPAGAEHQLVGGTSPDGRFVSLAVGRADRPREGHVFDWQTGRLTAWTLPSAPEVDLSRVVPAELSTYPARDGTPIPMVVRRPAACRAPAPGRPPCPVIVHFHGGPEGQSRPGFSPIWQLFLDAGFTVVEPNVRGSTGYGQAWLDADNGARRLQVISDIEDAARHLKTAWAHEGVAPKLGVFGGSYGGYAALMAMTRFAGAYDAGASSVGIANLLTFLNNTAAYRRALRTSEYGDPETDREALVQLSPTTWVHQLKAPLLLIQGANDPRVPVGEALLMHDAARARGVPVDLMIFADEGHGASSRANQALEFGHLLRFFRQHLQP